METEGGKSRSDREKLALHPSADDFPVARQMDSETVAKFLEFSDPAKATTRQLVLDYASKLIHAASTAKENVDGDNVSEANVLEAAYGLNRREGKGLKKLAGILGGLLLGTGLSTLVSVIQAEKFDRSGIILTAVTGVLGAFLIAVDLPQDILSRWRKRKPSAPPQPAKVRRRPASQPKAREPGN